MRWQPAATDSETPATEDARDYTYIAFISYRHKPLDKQAAELVQRRIERYVVPLEYQEQHGGKRLGKVFRDEDELPASSSLSRSITYALDHSKYLLVVCTPSLPKSQYCEAEIRYFLETHDRDHVLAILVDGEPEEAFSPLLLHTFDEDGNIVGDVEPLAANISSPSHRINRRAVRKEIVRVYAALLGCPFDALWQRERRARTMRAATGMALVMVVLTAFLAVVLNRNAKIHQSLMASYVNAGRELGLDGDAEEALAYYAKVLSSDPDNEQAKVGALVELQRQPWLVCEGEDDGATPAFVEDAGFHAELDYVVDGTRLTVSLDDGRSCQLEAPTLMSDAIPERLRAASVAAVASAELAGTTQILVWYGGYLHVYALSDAAADEPATTDKPLTGTHIAMVDTASAVAGTGTIVANASARLLGASTTGLVALLEDENVVVVDALAGKVLSATEFHWNFADFAFDPSGNRYKIQRYSSSDWGDTGLLMSSYDVQGHLLGESKKNVRYHIVGDDYRPDGAAILWADTRSLRLLDGFTADYATPALWVESYLTAAEMCEDGSIRATGEDGATRTYRAVGFASATDAGDAGDAGTEATADPALVGGTLPVRFSEDRSAVELTDDAGTTLDRLEAQELGMEAFLKGDRFEKLYCDEQSREVYLCGRDESFKDHLYRLRIDASGTSFAGVEELAFDRERETLTCNAFPGGFAVAATGSTVFVYRTGETQPWRTINPQHESYIDSVAASQEGYLAVKVAFVTVGTKTTHTYVELWDLETGTHLADLEDVDSYNATLGSLAFDATGTKLCYTRGTVPVNYYKRDRNVDVEQRTWTLAAPDPDRQARAMLEGLSSYELTDDLSYKVKQPTYTGNLGNWDSVLQVVE